MQAEDILTVIDRAKQKATEIVKSGGLAMYKATRGINPVSSVVSAVDTARKVSNLPINTPNYQGTVRSLASDAFKNTQTGLPQTLREGFVIPKRTPTGWTTENKPTVPSTWVANRVVAPAMNVPESAKQVKTGFQKVLGGDIKGGGIEAGIGELGVVGGLSPGPEDLAFSMYDATKAHMAGNDRTKGFTGEELKFGGERANNLYDKQVKSIVEKLSGGKVEEIDLGLDSGGKKKQFTYLTKPGDTNSWKILDQTAIRPGIEVKSDGTSYVITDVLGNSKFKAVPKSNLTVSELNQIKNGSEFAKDISTYKNAETFDISQKKTTQQAIRLTPEIKARIRGEAPPIKQPSGGNPDLIKAFSNVK